MIHCCFLLSLSPTDLTKAEKTAKFFPKRVDLGLGFHLLPNTRGEDGEEERCLVGLFSVGQVDVSG